jgi:hypothetical protein
MRKHYTFKRESNNFDDIIKDPSLKKYIKIKIKWSQHLMIGLSYNVDDSTIGYMVLKYGEDITNPINKDYTPIPGLDYIPKRN